MQQVVENLRRTALAENPGTAGNEAGGIGHEIAANDVVGNLRRTVRENTPALAPNAVLNRETRYGAIPIEPKNRNDRRPQDQGSVGRTKVFEDQPLGRPPELGMPRGNGTVREDAIAGGVAGEQQ